jgi:hypothetical protein
VKNRSAEHQRLAQAAIEVRDALRRLSARIGAAGEDPHLRSQALAAAHQVAVTQSDMLRAALRECDTRARMVAQT